MPRPQPELRYRIVCYELEGDQQTVILDATVAGSSRSSARSQTTARCAAQQPTPGRSRSDGGSPV
jgi:hypothetical protein